MQELFRREAVLHATGRLPGDVLLATPTNLRAYAAILTAVVIVGLCFITLAVYNRSEDATGWVVPHGGIIRIAAHSSGTVERIFVKEGDAVRVGDPIAELQISPALAAGNDVDAATTQALLDETSAAQKQADAAKQKLLEEERALSQRIGQFKAQIAEAKIQISDQFEQIKIAQIDLQRYEKMYLERAVSDREVQQRRAAVLSAEQTLSQMRSNTISLQKDLVDAETSFRAIPSELATAEATHQSLKAQITQKEIETHAQNKELLIATISGRVQAMLVDVGQVVAAGGTLAVITPQGSTLEVELYAPSRAVGFVRPGQSVHVMYQAFPHEKFGFQLATVTSVSHTILSPSEVAIPGIKLQEPVFRVRAAIPAQGMYAYGQYVPLQPGMLADASIVFDRRTLVQWLFDPIYAVRK